MVRFHAVYVDEYVNYDTPGSLIPRTHLRGLLPLDGITVILGANSSGKTTLIEILTQELREVLERDDDAQDGDDQNVREHLGSLTRLFVRVDVGEGSPDRSLLGRLRLHRHPRYETVDDVIRSIPGLPFEQGMAVVAAENYDTMQAVEGDLLDHFADGPDDDLGLLESEGRSPALAKLKSMASGGILEVVPDGDGTEVAIADELTTESTSFAVRLLGRAEGDVMRQLFPPLVVAPAELIGLDRLVEGELRRIADAWLEGILNNPRSNPSGPPDYDPWVTQTSEGGTGVAAGVTAITHLLETETSRLLPPFSSREGNLRVKALPPSQWWKGPRLLVGFERGKRFTRAEFLGAGTRRWIAVCLMLAARRVEQFRPQRPGGLSVPEDEPLDYERLVWRGDPRAKALFRWWTEGPVAADPPTQLRAPFLIVDEPELHLHPDAQQQIARWFARLDSFEDLGGVACTTHSPSMLTLPSERLHVAILHRRTDKTTIEVVDDDILNALDEAAVSQGFGREAWFFATRAVLVVEGQHDLEVIEKFYGDELRRARIRVLPLQGTKNSKRLFESEFLGASGLRLFVLFDNVRLDQVRGRDDPAGLTEEEAIIWNVWKQAQRDDIEFLPYPEPDILCALPLDCLRRRYSHLAQRVEEVSDDAGYWARLIDEWRGDIESSGRRVSFKRWSAETLFGLKEGTDLVRELLPEVSGRDAASPRLQEAIDTLHAHLSDRDLWQ